jgi:hypothetical protein
MPLQRLDEHVRIITAGAIELQLSLLSQSVSGADEPSLRELVRPVAPIGDQHRMHARARRWQA